MTQARTLNNRYEIQSKLGDGGMAAVYKALDLKLNRIVAVKILRDSYASDPQFLTRFKREAQQAASLNHPNIVRVFDVGDDGDYHYIVMEYIEGPNLKDVILREAPFPNQRALELGAQICDAIAYSHANGLIHRDIKPQNILLDKTGRVKVADFGIAKSSTSSTLTEAGITLGTVHYFSPEQAKGQPVLPQSDIYSIGIVLYEMMTGRIPFDSDNPVALALKHIEDTPLPPRQINPNIPPVVEQIILRTLAKNPAQRYSSAEQLGKALRTIEAQAEQGTQAVRPTTSDRRPSVPPPPPVSNQRSVVPPPNAYPGFNDQNPTYYQPTRPPQPVQPTYDDYPAEAPRRNGGPRYTEERPSRQYRASRAPLVESEREYEEDYPRRSGGGCLPWFLGGAAFLMVVALIVVLVVVLPSISNNPKTPTALTSPLPNNTPVPVQKVKVPVLVGKTQQEAETALKAARLDIGEIKQENNATVEQGKVISTDPPAGRDVDAGIKVSLTVSKGKDVAPLTDYANTPPDLAQKQLEALGFKVERAEENSDAIQKGAVIRTEPKGGDGVTATKGSTIKLIVSKGPLVIPTATPVPTTAPPQPTATPTPQAPPVPVPGVVSRTREDGLKILQTAGFKVRVEEWDENELRKRFTGAALDDALNTYRNLKKGDVLGTDPPEGQARPRGTEILMAVKK